MASVNKPTVNVYVLANGPAAGFELNQTTTETQLKNLKLSGDVFALQKGVPAQGLPFCGNDSRELKGTYPVVVTDNITINRLVAKILFVFSQLEDELGEGYGDLKIQEIKLDRGINTSNNKADGHIYIEEVVFRNNTGVSQPKNYVKTPLDFLPDPAALPEINHCKIPSAYVFDQSQSRHAYHELIYSGIEKGELSSWGPFYLRETAGHMALEGHITWQVGNKAPVTSVFTIPKGDFERNHSVVIYAYFVRDEIRFSAGWDDWDDGIDFYLTD